MTTSTATDDGMLRLAFHEPWVGGPASRTSLDGIFVASAEPWTNLAECLSSAAAVCTNTELPVPDGWAPAHRREDELSSQLSTRDVGEAVVVAGVVAYRKAGEELYAADVPGVAPLDGPADILIGGGDWPRTERDDVLFAPTRLAVSSPDPLGPVEVFDLVPVPLRWTPGTSGDVVLLVGSARESRVYHLVDDGAYDLDLRDLGLPGGSAVDLVLQRRTRVTVPVDAHALTVEIASVQSFSGLWSPLADRPSLTLYDTCADAAAGSPALPGRYVADFTGFLANHDPEVGGCSGYPEVGPDAVVPVVVPAAALLEVDLRLLDDDGAVYLLLDCADEATCVSGSDALGAGGTETLSWFNSSGSDRTVWVVFDAYADVTSPAVVDLSVTQLADHVLAATCVAATENGPVPPGTYDANLATNADLLAPGCSEGAAAGEGVAQIELLPGQTLGAGIEVLSGGDPQLYLMWNCGVPESCFQVVDARTDAHETMVWANDSEHTQRAYLVVDGQTAMNEVRLTLGIE